MKPPSASYFLFRSYLIILVGIVLVAFLLDTVLGSMGQEELETQLQQEYAPLFALLATNLAEQNEDLHEQWLKQTTANWSLPATILKTADFAGDNTLLNDLHTGRILVFYDNQEVPILYQYQSANDYIIALGPLPVGAKSYSETLIISAYYGLIALLVLLWIRPFYRDLSLLRKTALDFGNADFSARVHLDAKSAIFPMAQSFNLMAQRIEDLISAHQELTNAVSHELRTPLTRFRFSLEILARNSDESKKQHYLENMKADVTELECLIDELLSYARLSEQNLLTSLAIMDLRAWINEELMIYKDDKISISCSFNSHSNGNNFLAAFNPDLLARALHNIIRNSLRYANAHIALNVTASETVISIKICDDGPGIPDNMREKIFEPFARLETSRDKSSGGYGLGLAIAARILERHQGRVSVFNCEPTGACFLMQWPRLSAADQKLKGASGELTQSTVSDNPKAALESDSSCKIS